jgi:hypothetical protein
MVDLLDTAMEFVHCLLDHAPAVLQALRGLHRVGHLLGVLFGESGPESIASLIGSFLAIFSRLKPQSAELEILVFMIISRVCLFFEPFASLLLLP